jgi:xanthine dehydrogenase YagS FAD-binding subunit
MESFAYVRQDEPAVLVEEASKDSKAKFIGGGTNLVDLMKLYVEKPSQVIDVNHAPFDKIEVTDAGVRIGALVRNSDLAYHEEVRTRFPVLSEALLAGATPQLRNMATVGGNLMQRTRCPYFRDIFWSCNKREPGAGCSALDGYNRSHAVLGTSDKCIATHPSDMCVALAVLDAVIHTQSSTKGERTIPFSNFHISYGDDPVKETVLESGELITAIVIPVTPFFRRSHYLKVRDRASFEFALASAAVALEIQDGTITAARVALGGVATKPWRSAAAEKALVGAKPAEHAYAAAASAAMDGARAQKHNGFKIELAKRVIVRALTTVGSMA